MRDVEIAEIERFLLEGKTLNGNAPTWQENSYKNMWQFRWGVLDSIGAEYAELCFTTNQRQDEFSISLIIRKRMVYRIDVIPTDAPKPNPPDADKFELPGIVCGSHTHPWNENKEYCRINGFCGLPYRKPTPTALFALPQALAHIADETNVTLTTMQRDVRLPDQGGFF